jgi:hypothetical protein
MIDARIFVFFQLRKLMSSNVHHIVKSKMPPQEKVVKWRGRGVVEVVAEVIAGVDIVGQTSRRAK